MSSSSSKENIADSLRGNDPGSILLTNELERNRLDEELFMVELDLKEASSAEGVLPVSSSNRANMEFLCPLVARKEPEMLFILELTDMEAVDAVVLDRLRRDFSLPVF